MKRQVKRGFGIAVTLLAASVVPSHAAPEAKAIMEQVRLYQLSQKAHLEGRIRNEDEVTPFQLELDRGVMKYHLQNPPQTLTVRLSSSASSVSGAKDLSEPIRGTDVTLEDLAMKFLYWDRAELQGEQQMIAGRPAWMVRVRAPSRSASSYAAVTLWVDKESGAMVRAEAYGWDGKAAKRFEVRSIQRDGGGWLLKQMRIQSLEGTRSRDRSPTYLEIEKPD